MGKTAESTTRYKKLMTHTRNPNDRIMQWGKWTKQQFHIPPDNETPQAMHITPATWKQMQEQQMHERKTPETHELIPPELKHIRDPPRLQSLVNTS